MYHWALRHVIRLVFDRFRHGDVRWTYWLLASEVRFQFPGRHSWAVDFRQRSQARPWLERPARVGLQLVPHDVLIDGPPWKTLVCVLVHDVVRDPPHRKRSKRTPWLRHRFTVFATDSSGDVVCPQSTPRISSHHTSRSSVVHPGPRKRPTVGSARYRPETPGRDRQSVRPASSAHRCARCPDSLRPPRTPAPSRVLAVSGSGAGPGFTR